MTVPNIKAIAFRSIPLALLLTATPSLAQEVLAPVPGQAATTPAPGTTAPSLSLQPLPGAPSLPGGTDTSKQFDASLITERNQLYERYLNLKTRMQNAQALDTPANDQTLESIVQAQTDLESVQQDVLLREWTAASANTLLQTINGRPLNGVATLPAGTVISPRFMTMRLAATSYDRPSTEAGIALYNVQQGAPILELANTPDGAWVFVWVPGSGYSYVLRTLVSPLGGG